MCRELIPNTKEILLKEYNTLGTKGLSLKYNVSRAYFRNFACLYKIKFDGSYLREQKRKNKIVYCSKCKSALKTLNYKPKSGILLCRSCRTSVNNTGKKMNESTKIKIINSLKKTFENAELRKYISDKAKERFKNRENHPMYGKHHSKETIEKIKNTQRGRKMKDVMGEERFNEVRKKLSLASSGINNPSFGIPRYPTLKFIEELNHNVRSLWEKEVCLKLKKNNINYEYESQYFKIIINDKVCSYTPDIKINNLYIEIKGPLFDYQIEKMKEFSKNHTLIIITGKSNFKRLSTFNCINYYDFIKDDFKIEKMLENVTNN